MDVKKWPTLSQVRLCAGLTVGLYVTMHLSNHALGLVSVRAQEAARPYFMWFWHSPVGQVLLYGSLILHALLAFYSLLRRRHFRMPRWELLQIVLGFAIPYLLLLHITNTRGTRILTGRDIDYEYEISMLWVDPLVRFKQVVLVLLVWGHFAIGLHFWLRVKSWYRRAFPAMLLAIVLIPTAALLGFAEIGKDMNARAMADKGWYDALKKSGIPKDPRSAKIRAHLREWVGPEWLGLVGVAVVIAFGRQLL